MNDERDDIIDAELNGDETTEETTPASEGLVLASEVLPPELPILPLRPRPAFPGLLIPMAANGPEQVGALQRALDSPSQTL